MATVEKEGLFKVLNGGGSGVDQILYPITKGHLVKDQIKTADMPNDGTIIDTFYGGLKIGKIYGKVIRLSSGTPTMDDAKNMRFTGITEITTSDADGNSSTASLASIPYAISLRGLAAVGNIPGYTDIESEGSYWTCDIFDGEQKTLTKKIGYISLDEYCDVQQDSIRSQLFYINLTAEQTPCGATLALAASMASRLQYKEYSTLRSDAISAGRGDDSFAFDTTENRLYFCFSAIDTTGTVSEAIAKLANSVNIYYILNTPIVSEVPSDVMSELNKLKSYAGSTTVTNNTTVKPLKMEIKYGANELAAFALGIESSTVAPSSDSGIAGNATLLLDTDAVKTSETTFTLSESWKNYKILFVTAEMNFSSAADINLYNETFYTDTIRTDMNYVILREVGASSNATGYCKIKFNDVAGYNTVILSKQSTTYNGCRRIQIYGIK